MSAQNQAASRTPFAELSGGRVLIAAFLIALTKFIVVLHKTKAND